MYLKVWWLTSDPKSLWMQGGRAGPTANPGAGDGDPGPSCLAEVGGSGSEWVKWRATKNCMRHQSLASSTRTWICTQSRICPLTCAHPYTHAHRGRNGFYRHTRLQLRSSLPAKGPRVKEMLLPTSAMHKRWNFKGWDLMGGLGYWALCASTMRGWITTGPVWAQTDSETSCLLTF